MIKENKFRGVFFLREKRRMRIKDVKSGSIEWRCTKAGAQKTFKKIKNKSIKVE